MDQMENENELKNLWCSTLPPMWNTRPTHNRGAPPTADASWPATATAATASGDRRGWSILPPVRVRLDDLADELAANGWLAPLERGDRNAVRTAVERILARYGRYYDLLDGA
jgi:hypothetical protein